MGFPTKAYSLGIFSVIIDLSLSFFFPIKKNVWEYLQNPDLFYLSHELYHPLQ